MVGNNSGEGEMDGEGGEMGGELEHRGGLASDDSGALHPRTGMQGKVWSVGV